MTEAVVVVARVFEHRTFLFPTKSNHRYLHYYDLGPRILGLKTHKMNSIVDERQKMIVKMREVNEGLSAATATPACHISMNDVHDAVVGEIGSIQRFHRMFFDEFLKFQDTRLE